MKSKVLSNVIVIGLIITYFAVKNILGTGIVDDTYIFLRYADNFASGHGLVFNVNEYVEGYTSPFWMIILAGVALCVPDLVFIVTLLSGILGIATIIALFFMGQSYLPVKQKLLIVIPCWYLVTNPSFVFWTWSGMETALFVFLFVLSCLVFTKQVATSDSLLLSGAVFCLAVFTRLDMISTLPAYLLFIFLLNRHQAHLLGKKYFSFLIPLALILIHFLWRYYYYEDVFPNTYYAKVDVERWVSLSNGLFYTSRFWLAYGILLIIAFLVPPLLCRSIKRLDFEWSFCLVIVFIWSGYVIYVGGDHFALFRFFIPVIALLTFLFTILIGQILINLKKGDAIATLLALVFILTSVNIFIYRYAGGMLARQEVFFAENWKAVGIWFRDNVPADITIACEPVGAIPYYSKLKTYDMLGLTSREVAKEGKVNLLGAPGHQKYNTDYILSEKPDYIIYVFSGWFDQPQGNNYIELSFSYPEYDVAHDERTNALYEHQAVRMENGRYIEFLRLKQE
jgi:arabinofuranosyltransferase